MVAKFDFGIVGGGPAGYTAAFQARKAGKSVVLFEKDLIGGVCLNLGCIPTKTILHSAELFEEMKNSACLGIESEGVKVDFEKVMAHKDEVVAKIRKNLELALKNSGTVVIKETAEILNSHTISAGNEIYECREIICATGSKPAIPPAFNFDGKFILNSDDILNLRTLPKSVVIAGSGAIGTEWARIFSAFGVNVTVVELAEHLLPLADIEVSKRLERIFKSKKIKFFTSTSVEKVDCDGNTNGNECKVTLSNGTVLSADFILMATGRKPIDHNKIDGVKYLGDIYGSIQLAHFAIKQAISETAQIPFCEDLIPSVIYGNPEIAWVGMREQDLEAGTYQKSTFLISALGKSHCDNSTDGFIKLLSQNDLIVGAHIVSKEASALIQEILIAMQNKISVEKLKEVCFAHPTYSEGIFECLCTLK
ncbi:hypothetical protein DBY21_04230 [Candidatus Gastranaerophilales bacterium]|nr:MAG: hypothetical protein DBY21_04230 [Candidatus Gastranaerophilales bacterium]